MDLIGRRVSHKKFGLGTVTEQDNIYIFIKFDKMDEKKKFSYPSCFRNFIRLLDSDAAAETRIAVQNHEKKVEEEKEEKIRRSRAKVFSEQMEQRSSKSNKTIELNSYFSVEDFCQDYCKSIINEISYLRNKGGKRQRIFDGKRIEINNGSYVYSFESDEELSLPEGTQISLWIQGSSTSSPGKVISCEEFTIVFSTLDNLGNEVTFLEFSAEPWKLLSALNERLAEMKEHPTKIVDELVCKGHRVINKKNHRIITGQDFAIQMSKTQPITFIWGPPGTGKTQTLAKIALAHIELGHRVLMLSYSNVSVDGALMRTHELSKNKKPGQLIRYGYPKQKDLVEHEYLTSYNLAIRNNKPLINERKRLLKYRNSVSRLTQEYVQIERKLADIKKKLSGKEKELVKTARFVATTISKAVIDKTIWESEFDVVIFDEASMAYIPQIVYAASLAKSNFVCMGDFRQLPPIVQSDSGSILNADIFQYCGITSAVNNSYFHPWLCMLDTQYRMHPDIADFASNTMYGGLLHSAAGMKEKRAPIVEDTPVRNHALAFADLSGMMSVCTKVGDGSRINVLSAFLSFSLALDAAQKSEVGVITPYRAQSKLLHAMSRDIIEKNLGLHSISCATVHQFQGSEKDVIIYDAVDCYRMQYPGMLLTSTGNNYANRLFNVALTRARGKFIGVANIDYMKQKKISNNLMFGHMINTQRGERSCVSGNIITKSPTGMEFFPEESATKQFINEICSANREIRIDIPDSMEDNKNSAQIAKALLEAKKRGVQVYIRAEKKKNLPEYFRHLAIENTFVSNPIAIIDKEIVWFGMPISKANFRIEGVCAEITTRPIIRFKGRHTALALYGFMEMGKIIDQSKVEDEQDSDTLASYIYTNEKCKCGSPMKLRKSNKNGKYFLGCSNYPECKEMKPLSMELLEEYLYRNGGTGQKCIKCGYSLDVKKGPYGIYIQCCGFEHHRYKMGEI